MEFGTLWAPQTRNGNALPYLNIKYHTTQSKYFRFFHTYARKVGRVAKSVQRLATGWTVRGSNPGEGEFFAHVQTDLGAHPASCTMGTGSFPGIKRQGRGVEHPPPPSAEVENEYSYTFTPLLGPWWLVIG
jgi:hypothetical protein